MKFSIITPCYIDTEEKKQQLLRCIESVNRQEYDHDEFEHVIVNDGSPYPTDIPKYSWIKVINQPNLQRMTAYNTGFKNATGDIFTLLDHDDEYDKHYLGAVDWMFLNNKKYKMFNFGCKYIYKDGKTAKRDAFKPKMEKKGHEVFGGGNIVNGTFVFKKEVYDKLGAFPEGIKTINVPWYKNTELFWTSPYDFSAYAQAEFPEIKPLFMLKHPDHPAGLPKELGNPYGNDYYLFYKYTRKYHSKPIDDKYLYIVHAK